MQPAWDFFSKGDLAGAERAVAVAAQQDSNMALAPIPDIMIIKAIYLCRLHRFQEARSLFGRVLEDRPDDAYAQAGYLLALQDQLTAEGRGTKSISQGNSVSAENGSSGTLLLGLGTGRSGSTTLTRLWQEQDDCYCSHEHPPRLNWDVSIPRLEFHKRRIDVLLNGYRFVGDVSHWWLPYLENILEAYQSARVVVLKRDMNATIESFLRIKGGGGKGTINHWIKHDGSYWVKNIWDECYPGYDVATMKEAIERYWNNYYASVETLMRRFPSLIKEFPTERLGERDTQAEILSFCGFGEPKIIEDLQLNKGGASAGERMY